MRPTTYIPLAVIVLAAAAFLILRASTNRVEKGAEMSNSAITAPQRSIAPSANTDTESSAQVSAAQKNNSSGNPTSNDSNSQSSNGGRDESTEDTLITREHSVDVSKAKWMLASNDAFSKLMTNLTQDGTLASLTMQTAFRNSFMTSRYFRSGDIHLNEVICSARICATSFSATDLEKAASFIEDISNSKEPPVYALVQGDVSDAAGVQKRIIFSADKTVDALSM